MKENFDWLTNLSLHHPYLFLAVAKTEDYWNSMPGFLKAASQLLVLLTAGMIGFFNLREDVAINHAGIVANNKLIESVIVEHKECRASIAAIKELAKDNENAMTDCDRRMKRLEAGK